MIERGMSIVASVIMASCLTEAVEIQFALIM